MKDQGRSQPKSYRSARSRDPDVREGQVNRAILSKKRLSVDSAITDLDTLPNGATLAQLTSFVKTWFTTDTGKLP